jgi:hypothetical protein
MLYVGACTPAATNALTAAQCTKQIESVVYFQRPNCLVCYKVNRNCDGHTATATEGPCIVVQARLAGGHWGGCCGRAMASAAHTPGKGVTLQWTVLLCTICEGKGLRASQQHYKCKPQLMYMAQSWRVRPPARGAAPRLHQIPRRQLLQARRADRTRARAAPLSRSVATNAAPRHDGAAPLRALCGDGGGAA